MATKFKPTQAEIDAAAIIGQAPPTTAKQAQADLKAAAAQGLSPTGAAGATGSTGIPPGGFNPGAISTGPSTTPGVQVPADLKNIEIPYAAKGQTPFGSGGDTGSGIGPNQVPGAAAAGVNLTYAQIVAMFRELSTSQREDIQRNLYQAGFYGISKPVLDGTFTTADLTALQQASLQAYSSGIPLTTLLLHGSTAGSLVSQLQAYRTDIQAAEQRAQAATAPSVSLTDPNTVRQAFAVAMEAMGAGAPTPEQADEFAQKFRDAEVQAVQSMGEAQKQGLLSSIPQVNQAEQQLMTGNAAGAATTAAQPGPVTVATKSLPNLDAEARAAAQQANPAAYYSNQMSLLGGLIKNALDGTSTFQTRPETPSQTAPVGASLGVPFQGM